MHTPTPFSVWPTQLTCRLFAALQVELLERLQLREGIDLELDVILAVQVDLHDETQLVHGHALELSERDVGAPALQRQAHGQEELLLCRRRIGR